MTRVLLIDGHPLIRHGLAALVKQESDLMVCGEAADGSTILELMATAKPDLAIIDIAMNDRDGIEWIKEIHSRHPHVRLLVLSTHDEKTYAERALRAGACGYVMKTEAPATIMNAIRRVLAGGLFASDMVTNQLQHRLAGRGGGRGASTFPIERLSNREFQIFQLLGEGIKVSAIAAQLCLSPKTVETHRANIRKKLGIGNSADLLRYAIRFSRTAHK